MHDAMGRKLKEGDVVLIPAVITKLHGGEDYWNVYAKSLFGRQPDGAQETFGAVNTYVMIRANDLIDILGFEDVDDEGEGEPECATVH